ncbi:hypothetical protein GCM10023187_26140 [Nibrella viscosa]|uniref:Uncharacterized protein n=1 Tax=Nibrella viscosa TaxID=1084524 RepID=A0ABP8KGH7_9BACT
MAEPARLTIHAIATGAVRVKVSHRNSSLGFGQILLDPRWTGWMPIYCWVIAATTLTSARWCICPPTTRSPVTGS